MNFWRLEMFFKACTTGLHDVASWTPAAKPPPLLSFSRTNLRAPGTDASGIQWSDRNAVARSKFSPGPRDVNALDPGPSTSNVVTLGIQFGTPGNFSGNAPADVSDADDARSSTVFASLNPSHHAAVVAFSSIGVPYGGSIFRFTTVFL